MPIKDYIISTLNLKPDDIETFNVVRKGDAFYTHLTVKDHHPCCPVCGAPTKSKGFIEFTFQTMPVNSFTHYVIWHRRRYICKDPDCHYAFREVNRFTPGSLHSSYSLMNQIAKDLHNLRFTYKDIALKNNVSMTQIEVYADSFLNRHHLSKKPLNRAVFLSFIVLLARF